MIIPHYLLINISLYFVSFLVLDYSTYQHYFFNGLITGLYYLDDLVLFGHRYINVGFHFIKIFFIVRTSRFIMNVFIIFSLFRLHICLELPRFSIVVFQLSVLDCLFCLLACRFVSTGFLFQLIVLFIWAVCIFFIYLFFSRSRNLLCSCNLSLSREFSWIFVDFLQKY